MKNKEMEIVNKMNKIIRFLGPYGGIIEIEDDWKFSFRVNNLGNGEMEIEMFSFNDDGDKVVLDPFFRIEVKFDENRENVVYARPTEYLSQWLNGEMRIDKNDNICDSKGNAEHNDGELVDRLCSYLDTITKICPYLTNPKSVERFSEDVDCTFWENEPVTRKMKKEAIARMKLLGIDSDVMERFVHGKLTKIFVDHEERTIREEELTAEEMEIINNTITGSDIPFLAYYVICDTITWSDGETNTRYILPYVMEEKYDLEDEVEYAEGEVWGNIRKQMIESKMISCYVMNKDIPEYSEFGELPYRLLRGMLFVVD